MKHATGEPSGWPRAWRADRVGRYEAWGLLALLGPHVALGGWLLVVPDHAAFTVSQLIVLAHVVLGLVGTPIAVVWAYRHMVHARPRTRRTRTVVTVRWALTIAIALAFLSGFTTIGSSQGMPMAQWHGVLGIALAAILIWHLFLEHSTFAAWTVVGALSVSVLFVVGARDRIKGDQPNPVSPEFAFKVRETHLYDEAAWCGSCHVQNYEEWSRSTHGRSTDIQGLRRELEEKPELQHVDLAVVGRVANAENGSKDHQVPDISMQCPMCHAPMTYYADDPVPLLEATGMVHEGLTCSFCHTIRGIQAIPPEFNNIAREFVRGIQEGTLSFEDLDLGWQFRSTPFYVSAPETVRRYIGQASSNAVARWIGDYLITWRPEVHRRDYHSKFLDGSQACQGCHGAATDMPESPDKTYPDWEASDYNSPDESKRVECQDCHMVGRLTGSKVTEPGRLVPWGPIRAQRRSHLFLGGNAAASLRFDSPETAEKQRELGRRSLRLSVEDVVIENDRVHAQVTLVNEAIGHRFPAYESLFRFAFIRLAAIDDAGNVIAVSPRPETEDSEVPGTPILYRWVDQKTIRILNDTTIAPHEARTFETWVDLPPDGPAVARVEARLGHNFDPEEFLVVGGPLNPRPGPSLPTADAQGTDAVVGRAPSVGHTSSDPTS